VDGTGQKVLDDRGVRKEKAVPMVVLVGHHSLPHPVWSCPLVGNTDLHRDLSRAGVGDNRLLQQLNILSESRRSRNFRPPAAFQQAGGIAIFTVPFAGH
jgi:hypothetical protein